MYAEILISVFKIVEWVDKKTSNIHLFVGENRDYSKLLLKLKNNSITDKEEDTLKKYYKNYNLLKKCLQKDENVNIIYKCQTQGVELKFSTATPIKPQEV